LELEGRLGVTGTFDEIFLTFLSRKIRSLTDSGLLGLVEEFLDDLVALVSFDGNEEDRVEFEDDLDDLKHKNGMFLPKWNFYGERLRVPVSSKMRKLRY